MTDITDLYSELQSPSRGFTAATPLPTYGEYFDAAAQATMAGPGNMMSENEATTQAYDERIAAIKNITGIELDNPMRGGYSHDARQAIRQEVLAGNMAPIDEKDGIPGRQRQIFDQKAGELQQKNPLLGQFGPIEDDAARIGKKAVADYARAQDEPGLNPFLKWGVGVAGGMWGERRDPLFIGSLFAGPTTAFGKTVLMRLATSAAINSGFSGVQTALNQPPVQAWRQKMGLENGVMPAAEETAQAMLFGLIPGAGFQALHEVARPLFRLMRGEPKPGDAAALAEKLQMPPQDAAVLRNAEEGVHADQEIIDSVKPPEGVSPELHDDMMAAALKRAGDPEEASPAAVMAVDATRPDAPVPERPEDQELHDEVAQRIEKAQPKSAQEAHEIADGVIDDFGRRDGMARTDAALAAEEAARTERAGQFDKVAANKKILADIEETLKDPVERKRQAGTHMFAHLERQRDSLKAWLAEHDTISALPEDDAARTVPWIGSNGKPESVSESALGAELTYRERKALDILAECK